MSYGVFCFFDFCGLMVDSKGLCDVCVKFYGYFYSL